MSFEMVCPRCGRVCFSEDEVVNHKCHDAKADLSAELALAAERRRGAVSIPIDATCMVCGEQRPCVRVVEIGWICLACQRATL
jgi:hypothetical protein